jgi:hypothetical protein
MRARDLIRLKGSAARAASLLLAFETLGACEEKESVETAPCEGAISCATKAQPDQSVRLADLGEFFTIVDPNGRTDYGQPDCPGHYVLEIARAPSDGKVSLSPIWAAGSPTEPCDYRVDFTLFGKENDTWVVLGRTELEGKAESGVCTVVQRSRCGAGQDQYDAPGLVNSDARYTTLRAALSVVDGQGKQVAIQFTGQKF